MNLHLPKNSQFLIGAVISSSCQSQAKCVIWTLNCSRGKMWKMANSVNGEVVSFDSTCKEALKKHFQILICLILSNQNQKPQFLHCMVSGKDLNWPCCQLSLGKAWYNFFDLKVLVRMKEILTEKPSSVVVVCLLQHIVYIQIEY